MVRGEEERDAAEVGRGGREKGGEEEEGPLGVLARKRPTEVLRARRGKEPNGGGREEKGAAAPPPPVLNPERWRGEEVV
jgi:hypothetical protein